MLAGMQGRTPTCAKGVCKAATAGCSGDKPVCDPSANAGVGECKQIEVLAFYTRNQDMADRAHAAYSRHANAWFPDQAKQQGFFTSCAHYQFRWSRRSLERPKN